MDRSLAFVPVNHQVLRRAAGSDDVGFTVAIEVGDFQILAGHRVVVGDGVGGLSVAISGGRHVKTDAGFAVGILLAPAGDDLIATHS